eukprot:Clim_evm2s176 gene=Clim_evmTU2s176
MSTDVQKPMTEQLGGEDRVPQPVSRTVSDSKAADDASSVETCSAASVKTGGTMHVGDDFRNKDEGGSRSAYPNYISEQLEEYFQENGGARMMICPTVVKKIAEKVGLQNISRVKNWLYNRRSKERRRLAVTAPQSNESVQKPKLFAPPHAAWRGAPPSLPNPPHSRSYESGPPAPPYFASGAAEQPRPYMASPQTAMPRDTWLRCPDGMTVDLSRPLTAAPSPAVVSSMRLEILRLREQLEHGTFKQPSYYELPRPAVQSEWQGSPQQPPQQAPQSTPRQHNHNASPEGAQYTESLYSGPHSPNSLQSPRLEEAQASLIPMLDQMVGCLASKVTEAVWIDCKTGVDRPLTVTTKLARHQLDALVGGWPLEHNTEASHLDIVGEGKVETFLRHRFKQSNTIFLRSYNVAHVDADLSMASSTVQGLMIRSINVVYVHASGELTLRFACASDGRPVQEPASATPATQQQPPQQAPAQPPQQQQQQQQPPQPQPQHHQPS